MGRAGTAAVFLDAGGTLITPYPSVLEIYRRAFEPLGIAPPANELRRAYMMSWAEFDARVGRGTNRYAAFPGGEREYWARFVARVLERLGRTDSAGPAADALVRAFTDASAWAVYPEVLPAIARLRARGLRLGVISNWDSRLRALLGDLGLADAFETITVSCEAGHEKPAPEIFEQALGSLGVEPGEAVHIGDDLLADYEGSRAAGLEAILLVRQGALPGDVRAAADLEAVLPMLAGGEARA